MLLQEIAINYPSNQGYVQLAKDYYAVFSLWKNAGSGAMAFGKPPTTHTRTKIVDEIFKQVVDALVNKIITITTERLPDQVDQKLLDKFDKHLEKINREYKQEDWLNLHATITDFFKKYYPNVPFVQRLVKIEDDPISYPEPFELTPVVANIIRANKHFLPGPVSKAEPEERPSPPSPPQRSVPTLTWPTDLPPLPQDATTDVESKRIPANYENMLKKFGYEWSEADNAYKRDETGVILKIRGDYSSEASVPGTSKRRKFRNLGDLFKRLRYARIRDTHKKKHSVSESYKKLFDFLYN
jgi:hypothetical protein